MFTSTACSEYYSNSIGIRPLVMERGTAKWKYSNVEVAPSCPRCASSNTKFCYYNNYSLSQPRYFCKGCRRYWTKGGSLRNVPIGGGCRKSRRARQGGGPGSGYTGPRLSPACMSSSSDETSGGAYIDMAAVFARYVNQNVGSGESSSPGDSSGSSSDNVQASSLDIDGLLMEDNITMFEYQKPLDLIDGGDDQTQQMPPHFSPCQDHVGQDFVYQDSNAFERQLGVLCDGMVADILWSDGITLPDFGFQQPMVQVQDCGLLSPDQDQLRISGNLVTDNLGSFDLSAYGFDQTP